MRFKNLAEQYASWWPSVQQSLLVENGDAAGVGKVASFTIQGPWHAGLRLQVRAIEVDQPRLVRHMVRGDLVGTGTHHLENHPRGTRVRFSWHVSTAKGWIGTVARPAFSYAHKQSCIEVVREWPPIPGRDC